MIGRRRPVLVRGNGTQVPLVESVRGALRDVDPMKTLRSD